MIDNSSYTPFEITNKKHNDIRFELLSDGLGFNSKVSFSLDSNIVKEDELIKFESIKKNITKFSNKEVVGSSIKLLAFILDTFFLFFFSLIMLSFLKSFLGEIFLLNKKIIFLSFIFNNIFLYSLLFNKNQSFAEYFFNIKYKKKRFNFYFFRLFSKAYFVNV